MNTEEIEKFLKKNTHQGSGYVKISFKKRDPVYGLFVRDKDYLHLRAKNFWRIVTKLNLDKFNETLDMSLARIFNGAEFSRLTAYAEVGD